MASRSTLFVYVLLIGHYAIIGLYLHPSYSYIYILGEVTEKSYNKPLERNVVYIPIFTFLVYLLKSPTVIHGNVMYFTFI